MAAVPEEQLAFSVSLLGNPSDTPPHSSPNNAVEGAAAEGPEASITPTEGLDASSAHLDKGGENSKAHARPVEEALGLAGDSGGVGQTSEDAGGDVEAEGSGSPARGRPAAAQGQGSGLVKAAVALFEKKEEGAGGAGLGGRGSGSLGPVPRGGAASLDAGLPSGPAASELDGANDAGAGAESDGVDGKEPVAALPAEDAESDVSGKAEIEAAHPAVAALVSGVFQRLLSTDKDSA